MRKQQQGITFIGWLFLLIPIAIVGYAGIRVTPYYLNYYKVVSVLEKIAIQAKTDDSLDDQRLRFQVGDRFNIEGITFPDTKDISIRKVGSGYDLQADYENVVPLFGNLQLLLIFNKTVNTKS
jgi:hypothetical protein